MKLSCFPLVLRLERPFRISREEKRACRNLFVRVEWERLVGMGEAAPSRFYGEDAEAVSEALRRAGPLIEGASPFTGETVERRLAEELPWARSARAALDVALWDLLGKVLGVPIYKLLGLEGAVPPPTSFTVGISSPDKVPRPQG
ncbi:MAG TPA: hypothetical protein EYP61_00610 [Candidatus Latescibacteria bacterium]|nr:hypothetical protein [Candidatus Latescibacterota bacterium]